jgi:peptidoglycan/xylan/chitin deacetylase (PgdA/CDA1 family)
MHRTGVGLLLCLFMIATGTLAVHAALPFSNPSGPRIPPADLTGVPAPTRTPRPTLTPTPTPLVKPQPDAQAARRIAHVPVLMYHYISAPPPNADRYRLDLSMRPETFEAQLKYLKDNGYTTISLYDLYNHLATGAALPPKPIALTFDDGHRDAYEVAFPLLQRYGMTGTFFIVTDFINYGDPDYLTWDMVQAMSQAGMSIESHTRTHIDLRGQSYEKLIWEILGPIEAITAHTGMRPRFFCYPSGSNDADVLRVLASVDTWAAVTTQYGASYQMSNVMAWPRIRIPGSTTPAQFAARMQTQVQVEAEDRQGETVQVHLEH